MTDADLPIILRIPRKEHVTKKFQGVWELETANNQKVVEILTC